MRRSLLAWCVVAGLGVAGCRSAGGPAVPAATEPTPDFVQSYVGQKRILLHGKDEARLTLRRGEAARPGSCASAVEVTRATWSGGVLHLDLSHLGRPALPGTKTAVPFCGPPPLAYGLAVSGFGAADGATEVADAVAKTLLTPETFLGERGVPFDRPPLDEPGTAAALDAPGVTAEERSLGRRVTSWPRPLLSVSPELRAGKKLRIESEVEFVGVVGADGRLHRCRVTSPLSASQQGLVEKALTLWRFEPAQGADGALPAHVSLRTALRLY